MWKCKLLKIILMQSCVCLVLLVLTRFCYNKQINNGNRVDFLCWLERFPVGFTIYCFNKVVESREKELRIWCPPRARATRHNERALSAALLRSSRETHSHPFQKPTDLYTSAFCLAFLSVWDERKNLFTFKHNVAWFKWKKSFGVKAILLVWV